MLRTITGTRQKRRITLDRRAAGMLRCAASHQPLDPMRPVVTLAQTHQNSRHPRRPPTGRHPVDNFFVIQLRKTPPIYRTVHGRSIFVFCRWRNCRWAWPTLHSLGRRVGIRPIHLDAMKKKSLTNCWQRQLKGSDDDWRPPMNHERPGGTCATAEVHRRVTRKRRKKCVFFSCKRSRRVDSCR
jgi:hypothetical protein